MLTPKEVEERRFPLVRFQQGYEIGSVDGFLDELTVDYTTLFEENSALKAKMKVLVQHIADQSCRIRDLENRLEEEAPAEPVRLTVLPTPFTEEAEPVEEEPVEIVPVADAEPEEAAPTAETEFAGV